MDSLFYLSSRLIVSVMLVGVLTTPTLASDLLSDEELDNLGAGGNTLGVQAPEGRLQALPDKELDLMSAAAFPTFVWPFQPIRSGIVTLLRTVPASDGKGGTFPLGIYGGTGLADRSTIPPQQ